MNKDTMRVLGKTAMFSPANIHFFLMWEWDVAKSCDVLKAPPKICTPNMPYTWLGEDTALRVSCMLLRFVAHKVYATCTQLSLQGAPTQSHST